MPRNYLQPVLKFESHTLETFLQSCEHLDLNRSCSGPLQYLFWMGASHSCFESQRVFRKVLHTQKNVFEKNSGYRIEKPW